MLEEFIPEFGINWWHQQEYKYIQIGDPQFKVKSKLSESLYLKPKYYSHLIYSSQWKYQNPALSHKSCRRKGMPKGWNYGFICPRPFRSSNDQLKIDLTRYIQGRCSHGGYTEISFGWIHSGQPSSVQDSSTEAESVDHYDLASFLGKYHPRTP